MRKKLYDDTVSRISGVLERLAAAGKLITAPEPPATLTSKAQIRLELQRLEWKLSKTLKESCAASQAADWGKFVKQTSGKADRCLKEVDDLLARMQQLTQQLQALNSKSSRSEEG